MNTDTRPKTIQTSSCENNDLTRDNNDTGHKGTKNIRTGTTIKIKFNHKNNININT